MLSDAPVGTLPSSLSLASTLLGDQQLDDLNVSRVELRIDEHSQGSEFEGRRHVGRRQNVRATTILEQRPALEDVEIGNVAGVGRPAFRRATRDLQTATRVYRRQGGVQWGARDSHRLCSKEGFDYVPSSFDFCYSSRGSMGSGPYCELYSNMHSSGFAGGFAGVGIFYHVIII